MITRGKHLILDLFECQCKPKLLDDKITLLTNCFKSVELSNNKLIKSTEHQFQPQGVSINLLLAESHLCLHTYPEELYVSIDIYSCGAHASPIKAVENIIILIQPKWFKIAQIVRGESNKKKFSTTVKTHVLKVDHEDFVGLEKYKIYNPKKKTKTK